MKPEQLDQKIANRICVIITNYGDDSLALIQWALESDLLQQHRQNKQLKVVYIETGFASCTWAKQVAKGVAYVESAGLEALHLHSQISFQEAVLGRGSFPSHKFQWCSTVLKGLPLLDWLDTIDSSCQAILLSAKRKETLLPPYHTVPAWVEKSEHFNERSLWHPLLAMNEKDRDQLLERANFKPLGHRSLECAPCINSSARTLALLKEQDIQKVKSLEAALAMPMFPREACKDIMSIEENQIVGQEECAEDIESIVQYCKRRAETNKNTKKDVASQELSLFYRGCGNPFSCGM